MRFLADGPALPSHLLSARNEGNVIFFCGAGISRRAGLPDFAGLTKSVVANLGANAAREAMERGESADRVFSLLVREFGQGEIDREIFAALRFFGKPNLACHQAIFDLSRGAGGQAQVVTTNFDLLFEAVEARVPTIVPPALPDLSTQSSINGVVYLHGRLREPEPGAATGYVISSADFGRAYLSEGWATRFVKSLRERYTIVLLGYRAEDPPMRYLLEGLNAANGASYNSPIYAFTEGDEGNAEEEWQDRGVTPICYPRSDGHASLWDTLFEWAEAVRHPQVWNDRLIDIARKRPTELMPHERGQIAELVGSKQGAKLFADTRPAPPAEWLCVFDANVRYAEARKKRWDDEKEIDPLDLFGLDDDPPRPPKEANGQRVIPGHSPLDWKHGDASFPERAGLRGWNAQWANQLPERLHHIARWFGDVMEQPLAAWWAAGWKQLNPNLLWFVSWRLERGQGDLPEQARTFWRLYLEGCDLRDGFNREYGWFEFKSMIAKDGWTGPSLRFLDRISRPRVEFSRERFGAGYPVAQNFDDLPLLGVVDAKVRVLDRHNEQLEIPNEQLAKVTAIVRRALLAAAEQLDELGTRWWRTPTLYPTGERGESFHGRKTLYLLWFRELFDRLAEIDPEASALEMAQWPADDRYFFGKLFIYAAASAKVVPASEAATKLSQLNDQVFWDPYSQREFLLALRARWNEFTTRQRRVIERRILQGPLRWEEEPREEFRRRRAVYSAERLTWLELNGCPLTPVTAGKLRSLKLVDPSWSDDWARDADRSLDARGGTVERVTATRGIESAPIGQILDEARSKTESQHGELRDFRPFEGLVAAFPFRALAALRHAMRLGEVPSGFWNALLSNWPEGTPLKLRWLAAYSISRLPPDAMESLRYSIPRWFKTHFSALAGADRERALAILDRIITFYVEANAEVTASSVGRATVGGVTRDHSEVSVSKAMNSPIGLLAETLWDLMPDRATKKRPMPNGVGERLERLFQAKGDGGGHGACVVAMHFPWLDHWFSEWSDRVICPMFAVDHPLSEAVWHGFAANSGWPSTKTLTLLCPTLLLVLKGQAPWCLDDSAFRHWVQRMVILTRPDNVGGPAISFAEAREVLVAIDDKGRSDALWILGRIASEKGAWTKFVKPFIERAWPRQVRFRTESASRGFARLVEGLGKEFPDAVRTVVNLLRPVAHHDMITYRITKSEEEGTQNVAREFPAEALTLLDALIPDDKSQLPYELAKVLEIIIEANPSLRGSPKWRRLSGLVG